MGAVGWLEMSSLLTDLVVSLHGEGRRLSGVRGRVGRGVRFVCLCGWGGGDGGAGRHGPGDGLGKGFGGYPGAFPSPSLFCCAF